MPSSTGQRIIETNTIKIISRFPTQMLCFPTQIKVGTLCVKDHQFLRLEHRLGLMEILKNLKRNIFVQIIFFCLEKMYIRGHLISQI